MKPDSYIPFYGNDFFMAVSGLQDETIVAYLRCIWQYWAHYHCEGLPDNDETLRRISLVLNKDDWPAIRDIIFDNEFFFTQDAAGLWHQKRAEEEWLKSVGKYQAQCKRTSAATKARLGGMSSNRAKRAVRVASAREKGTHTFEQWQTLFLEFKGRCVRCAKKDRRLQKDHIVPLYRGGSDHISNLQPICEHCNTSKGPETINWVKFRRTHGWDLGASFIEEEKMNFNELADT